MSLKVAFGSIMAAMMIDMNERRLCSPEQLQAFLDGTAGVQFRPFEGDDGRYVHIKVVLGRLAYAWLKRGDKGVVLAISIR